MRAIEMCAGAGGQALGLHQAGFEHAALIEIDSNACQTIRRNNQDLGLGWGQVIEGDLVDFARCDAIQYRNQIELVAGGVPCPPFSKAGLQLGPNDERDLFPVALDVVETINPVAVMLENVSGLLDDKFSAYREEIQRRLRDLGYGSSWQLLQASDFGVPQLRPRVILVAIQQEYFHMFEWPTPTTLEPVTVGDALFDLMAANGWEGAEEWSRNANSVAPTLVGGSKKHGGPDLGPTRAKKYWKSLGVNAHRVGNDDEIPGPGFEGVRMRSGELREGYEGMPLLNVRMAARLQGFPDEWAFSGTKTHAYRQVGNAFPPPVAFAVGAQLRQVIEQIQVNRGEVA